MAKKKSALQRGYMVKVHPRDGDWYRLSYVPHGLQQVRIPGEESARAPEHEIRVNWKGDHAEWLNPPGEQQIGPLADDAMERVRNLRSWVEQLSELIVQIDGWAKNLGWSTKRIERPMEDAGIGNYKAPALVLQEPEEASRVLVEPVARSAPGTEGVVDLYLMPAYDDIASLYYYGGHWNVHYLLDGIPDVGDIREADPVPLSQETLGKVLSEMKKNA
ncbi:MAG: hypothetical protein K2X38_23140 [Gemmataceae bacterium]|nr:hypothetical protein [Gemmataceae bacterium]